MRKLVYIVILMLLVFAPVDRVDAGKLLPVEALAVSVDGGQVVLMTDTGNRGTGATAQLALEDMKQKAAGILYLDTANFLLVAPGAETAAEELKEHMKRSVKTGPYSGGDVGEEARFLDAHWERAKPK